MIKCETLYNGNQGVAPHSPHKTTMATQSRRILRMRCIVDIMEIIKGLKIV